MSTKIKLLLCAKSIDGGTGTFLLKFQKIKKYFRKNLTIKTIVLERPSYRHVSHKSNISFFNKEPYPQKYRFSFANIYNFIREFLWVKKQVESFEPNIILSIDIHLNLLTQIVKTFFFKKAKTVLTTHIDLKSTLSEKATPFLYRLLKLSVTNLYNQADALVATSKQLSQQLIKDFKLNKKIFTIYYGININNIKVNSNKRQNIIISVGRLVEQKNFYTLINAFSLIQKKVKDCQLWIVGDGPLKQPLKNLAKQKKLSEAIKFLGWRQKVFSYLKKAKIFILSSKREGFSFALLEAMSQGVPVIATNSPFGPSEVLGDGRYGILLPMKDPQAMVDAMYQFFTDEKKYHYYSQKSLERAKYFSLDKMLRAYKKLIL